MGPTGAGKTVQGERLAAAKGYAHFSTGRLLRADTAAAGVLQKGQLAPAGEVERVLEAALVGVSAGRGIILDGFPRTIAQAEWLDNRLRRWSRQLRVVLEIQLDEATTAKRLALRGRSDDTKEAQARKRQQYQEIMAPVADVYAARGLLKLIDGRGSIEDVASRIEAALA
jgi:adenylate kinase